MAKNDRNGNHRNRAQLLLDRVELARLMRRGWTQEQIAQRFGISVSQVQRDWKVIVKRLQEQMLLDAKEHAARLVEELAEVKREAWCAWDKSKQDATRKVEEEAMPLRLGEPLVDKSKDRDSSTPPTSPPQLQKVRVTTTTEGRTGDPNYLRTVLQCIQAERELLGVDAPKESTTNVNVVNWDALIAHALTPGAVQVAPAQPLLEHRQEADNDPG